MIRLSAFQNKDGCSSISHGRSCPWGYSCAQRHPFDLCITMQIQWVILVWIFFSAPISVAGIDERWVHQQFFRIFNSFCLLLFSFSLNLLYEEYYFCRGDFHWERFNKREYFEVLRGLSDVTSGVSSALVPFFLWSWFLCCSYPPVSHVGTLIAYEVAKKMCIAWKIIIRNCNVSFATFFCVLALFWFNSHQ